MHPEIKVILAVSAGFALIKLGMPLEKKWEMNSFCHRYHFDYAIYDGDMWFCSIRIPPRDDMNGSTITVQSVEIDAVPDFELEAIDAQEERDK